MSDEPPRPTDAELEILTVLWSRGPSTVRDVHEVIAGRKPAQYTTVLKQLQVMAEKGLVRRDERQRSHVYSPARPREWTQRQLAGDLLHRAFDGSAKGLLLGALSARKTSKKELAELRSLLDEYQKGTRCPPLHTWSKRRWPRLSAGPYFARCGKARWPRWSCWRRCSSCARRAGVMHAPVQRCSACWRRSPSHFVSSRRRRRGAPRP